MGEQTARERILQAAIKVFAEKSFEGARVDEISREAKVPKSLIYYHFKSKDEILDVLIREFIDEYTLLLGKVPKETHQQKAYSMPDRMGGYYQFGQRYADLVRIVLMDSLKKTTEPPVIYRMLDAFIAQDSQLLLDEHYDVQERRVTEFFTSFLPNCAYLCFADTWPDYYKIDKQQFGALFANAIKETHGVYHKNHSKKERTE